MERPGAWALRNSSAAVEAASSKAAEVEGLWTVVAAWSTVAALSMAAGVVVWCRMP
jgi:hypothetical protein